MFQLKMFVASFITLVLFINVASSKTPSETPFAGDYVYHIAAEKFYKLYWIPTTWDRAEQICRREGARFAYPKTNPESDAFRVMQMYLDACGEPVDLWLGSNSTVNERGEPVRVYLSANRTRFAADSAGTFPFACERSEYTTCNATAPGYKVGPARSCYKLHVDKESWTTALLKCEQEGAYLAIINSKEEADYLVTVLEENKPPLVKSTNGVSIGFQDMLKEGKYLTVDGRPIADSGYEEWEDGEPNNFGGPENCGAMNWYGKLNDIPCRITNAFICEANVTHSYGPGRETPLYQPSKNP